MIKEIIVHLRHLVARDPSREFGISIAERFAAHVAGNAVVT
jgi:hypothetical protein